MELCEQASLHHHLSCSDDRFVVVEYVLQVQHRFAACPHFLSFCGPVPASQKDVFDVLGSLVTGALFGLGLVDSIEVSSQANLAGPHLADDGADRSWKIAV